MLPTFPCIHTKNEVPIKNISIGEYYYIQSGDDLFHGKVDHAIKQCVQVSSHRKIGLSDLVGIPNGSASYFTATSVFSTFRWRFGEPEELMDEVNICTTVNPSKTVMAAGMSNNTVILWDLVTLQIIQTLGKPTSEWVMCVKYNPRSNMIAAASTDSSVRIWCTLTFELLHLIPYQGTYVNDLSFTPDGSIIVFNGGGNEQGHFKIVFWSLGTNAECINHQPIGKYLSWFHNPVNGDDSVTPDDFDDDDNVYVNSFDLKECNQKIFMVAGITIQAGVSAVALWEFQKGYFSSRMVNFRKFSNVFTKIICHPSGNMVFACGIDGDIYVLGCPDLNILYTITIASDVYPSETAIITAFSLNAGGNKLIASTREGSTHIYNVGERRFEWTRFVEDPENYDEELDVAMMVEFGLGETHYISCSAYEITRAPFKKAIFIADEFLIEQAAVWFERGLPDTAKWLIREFVSGVAKI